MKTPVAATVDATVAATCSEGIEKQNYCHRQLKTFVPVPRALDLECDSIAFHVGGLLVPPKLENLSGSRAPT